MGLVLIVLLIMFVVDLVESSLYSLVHNGYITYPVMFGLYLVKNILTPLVQALLIGSVVKVML